jgi:uncharacterized membrane protein YhaH (DUF805 family)
MNFQSLFAIPTGRTSRGAFIGGLIVLLLATAFYVFLVKAGRNGEWVLVTLLFPAFMLHAGRLHDMGQSAWLLLAPAVPTAVAVWLHMYSPGGQLERPLTWVSLAIGAAFLLWGLIGKGQAEANRFGEPAAA